MGISSFIKVLVFRGDKEERRGRYRWEVG